MPQGSAADEELGYVIEPEGRQQPGLAAYALQRLLQGHTVEDRGHHPHVMGGGLLDDLAALGELSAAEDVPPADHHRQLHSSLGHTLDLLSDIDRLIDTNSTPFAPMAKCLAAHFKEDAAKLRPERITRIDHGERLQVWI